MTDAEQILDRITGDAPKLCEAICRSEKNGDELRKKVQAGVDELDRGEGIDGDEVFDELERGLDELEKRQGKT